MKKILLLIFAAALVSPVFAQTAKPNAEAFYRQGVAAERAGDPATARKAYQAALAANPNHANAQYRLGQLKIHSGAIAAKGREAKVGAVVVPEIRFDEVPLKEALDALQVVMEKQSKDEIGANFVIQDPENRLSAAKVTLSLKNTPAKAVIKYILDQTGAKARYDEHAIVIAPR